jgi:DNA (cytosine-5)-methyltransferase 1
MIINKTKKPWELFNTSPKEATNDNLTHISLFSGCGGFDLGFHQSGFKTVFAIDINKDAAETYRYNIGEICTDDIRIVDIPVFEKRTDVLTAGFPCQPFSNAGSRKGLEDGRGTLYQSALGVVKKTRPRAVVFENVRGILSCIKKMENY